MKTSYLQSKIDKEEWASYGALILLVTFSVAVGHYIDIRTGWRGFFAGVGLSLPVLCCFWYIKKRIHQSIPFEKGIKCEDDVYHAMQELGFECTRNIKTKNGDLDVLAVKDNKYYGIEVKNWSGRVELQDTVLIRNRNKKFRDHIVSTLKKRCREVRNEHYAGNPNVFIVPVMIFGYNTTVDIQQTTSVGGIDVVFLERRNLRRYFGTLS